MRTNHEHTTRLPLRNQVPPAVNKPLPIPSFAQPLAAQQLMSIEIVCLRLQINRRTLYRWLDAYQDFPRPVRIGRVIRFREREVMEWIDRREQQ